MDAFPAFFPLAGRRVAVVGDGEAAEAKARLFEGSPAEVVRLSGQAAASPEAYRGVSLAFVAEPDPQAAATAARAAGALVNVVDHAELSDFVTPAIIDRGAVVAALGTGGASPMLATMLRADIEARLPEGVGRIAALLRGQQGEIRAALPDPSDRRRFLRSLIDGPAGQAAAAGDTEGARGQLLDALAALAARGGLAAIGRIAVILAGGPADLISLRALRALGQADLIVVEPGASADILALARRDAARMDASGEALQAALAEAGRGRLAVWATARAPAAALADAAAGAGIALEILEPAPG
jgi:precorrin-2 dehydrogenase/sirohydrochlorin ferrochelatase